MSTTEANVASDGIDREKAIERLRASKLEFDNRERVAGWTAGKIFAANEAAAEELMRLSEWYSSAETEDMENRATVAGVISSSCDSADFWESAVGERSPSGAFVCGFVEGAALFWKEVCDQI